MIENKPFNVILLAGGIGKRMGTSIPKQYLLLKNKPLALYSFEAFLSIPEVERLVVVCESDYQYLFESKADPFGKVDFARPGQERQDSVFNGLQQLKSKRLVCIHDAARPLISPALVSQVVQAADEWGAAALGVPVKGTIKVCDGARIVLNTPKRSSLWEMQTPQVVRFDLLQQGFMEAKSKKIEVTDDVSLVELLGHSVKIVEGSYSNIKVTTLEDLALVEHLLGAHV